MSAVVDDEPDDVARWLLDSVLDSWREWVRDGRPDRPEYRFEYGTDLCDGEVSLPGCGFNPSDPGGGYDADGAPYGPHHWTIPRPPGFHWAVVRELLRHRHIVMYWSSITH